MAVDCDNRTHTHTHTHTCAYTRHDNDSVLVRCSAVSAAMLYALHCTRPRIECYSACGRVCIRCAKCVCVLVSSRALDYVINTANTHALAVKRALNVAHTHTNNMLKNVLCCAVSCRSVLCSVSEYFVSD